MGVFARLVGLLVVLLVGTGLRSAGVLDDVRTSRLNTVAYYVALPALTFVATYDQEIGDLLSLELFVGLMCVMAATVGCAWWMHRNIASPNRRSVALVQSYHANLGYLGLPLIAVTFSKQVTAVASVVLGVVSIVQLPMTLLILVGVNGSDAPVQEELRKIVLNPVLFTLLIGLTIGSTGTTVPTVLTTTLGYVSVAALPIALLCVGASLQVDWPTVDYRATGTVIVVKNLLMPAIAWIAFSLLSINTATFIASTVMFGTPTAVSTFVYAGELGGDEEFASLNVFLTTVASVGTLFLLITLLRYAAI